MGTRGRAEGVGLGRDKCARMCTLRSRALGGRWVRARRWGLAIPPALTSSIRVPSCVCKEGEVGDGRACYGHLLHEIQKVSQLGVVFPRLRVTLAMLGV